MTLLDIIAILLTLSALFGYANHQILRLPHTIGLMIMALAGSAAVVGVDWIWPELGIGSTVRGALAQIDFHKALMNGFLSALLFAGAVHVDLGELAQRKWAISLMATLGVLVSTFLVATSMWFIGGLIGFDLPFIWWLVFGALISPTDPVAVLGILKTIRIPSLLRAKIAGESLFNDGVGVVVFTVIVAIATSTGASQMGVGGALQLFAIEAIGGAILGLICGLIAYALMRSLDEHNLEVLITLALVAGTYAIALHLHVSGPIAVVIAGLLIGNHGARFAMSERTRQHIFQFWELTDEMLNSILFLLIGLEVLVISITLGFAKLALLAIPTVLLARLIAVALPIGLLSIRERFTDGAITILTWGGLRGGISVALALSLPNNEFKPTILAATYGVVIFSIVVQGLTMAPLVKRIIKQTKEEDPAILKEALD